ncbi:UNVERIFIED_CONTAM: putative glutathione S-transferase parC [Sesamum angustifolium]|uniref:Glutathione S-transferase n=1 Tax=Sesamum angustifolium TaxID=2727405 RepID=A0AAW2KZ85_9LAMI
MADEVVLLDDYVSMFGMRARVALAEKGVEYEYREESLQAEKSTLLLQMNPVHKQVPLLIHNGNPICESLIIVEYIDEVWKDKSPDLLPADPYHRAQARFWANFVDRKVYDAGRRLSGTKEEEQESGKKDFIAALKLLEAELGDKPYFGGENFGFLDVALIPFYTWFPASRLAATLALKRALSENMGEEMRGESVSKSLADPKKVYDFVLFLKKKYGR